MDTKNKLLTNNGIYLDIKQSDYYVNFDGLTFYFSSKLYMEKFKNNLENFIKEETLKLYAKYKITIEFRLYLAVAFYKRIEKRGFLIYNNIDKKFIDKNIVCISQIVM